MPRLSHLLLAVSFGFWLPVLAHSEEVAPKSAVNTMRFDTEHIFGSAEGYDTGAKGELEIESNLIYQPSFLRPNNKWEHDDSFIIIAGGSYAISPSILVGAEIRHANSARNGNFDAHALYIGPQLFVRLGSEFSANVAWAAQIPDVATHGLDLANYQRHQVELQLAYSF